MIFGIAFSSRWTHVPRQMIPTMLTVLLLLVQVLPWSRDPNGLMPSLVLMSIFFWRLHAPSLFPLVFILAIGGVADLMQLTPLGSQALVFLLLALVIERKLRPRFETMPFLRQWVLFAIVTLVVNLVLWLIELLLGQHAMPLGQALARTAIAIVLYPVITRLILIPAERLACGDANG